MCEDEPIKPLRLDIAEAIIEYWDSVNKGCAE
jgi:hypothetical protein